MTLVTFNNIWESWALVDLVYTLPLVHPFFPKFLCKCILFSVALFVVDAVENMIADDEEKFLQENIFIKVIINTYKFLKFKLYKQNKKAIQKTNKIKIFKLELIYFLNSF